LINRNNSTRFVATIITTLDFYQVKVSKARLDHDLPQCASKAIIGVAYRKNVLRV
jgi:hypothetical protein